jgi:hypothetical protein
MPGLRPGFVSKPANTSGGKLASAAATIISCKFSGEGVLDDSSSVWVSSSVVSVDGVSSASVRACGGSEGSGGLAVLLSGSVSEPLWAGN